MPASSLWSNNRDYRCTAFWRGLMRLREKLIPWILWNLGNGEICKAISQPWFQGAIQWQVYSGRQMNLTINNLVDHNSGLWISNLLGSSLVIKRQYKYSQPSLHHARKGHQTGLCSRTTPLGSTRSRKSMHFSGSHVNCSRLVPRTIPYH